MSSRLSKPEPVAPSGAALATPYVVAAVQTVSGTDLADNLQAAARLIDRAVAQGAQLVALPEYFALLGRRETDKVDARELPGDGPIQRFLADTARRHGIWLVGCSVPLHSNEAGKVYNSCLVYNAQGSQVARYDKIHLFQLDLGAERFIEARTIAAGRDVVALDTPFGRMGLSVCYDLRFPELYRAMGDVDIILVPAAFTATTGRDHWEPLLRARAIENLAYVVAPAQGGHHANGRFTHGDTMIVDPWGTVLARHPKGEAVVCATIDPAWRARVKGQLPALEHRVLPSQVQTANSSTGR